jgi:uncharacterized protein GlcG (DUF336 family)
MSQKIRPLIAALLCASGIQSAAASDVVESRLMSLELASDIAKAAVAACREMGYQVSAAVVDRSAVVQVIMRDVHASRFNTELAHKKANAVILSSASGTEFLRNRPEIIATMNQLDDVLVLQGGLPIRAAGSMIGAIGVSGALGGDKDEICAAKALEAVEDRLAFIE